MRANIKFYSFLLLLTFSCSNNIDHQYSMQYEKTLNDFKFEQFTYDNYKNDNNVDIDNTLRDVEINENFLSKTQDHFRSICENYVNCDKKFIEIQINLLKKIEEMFNENNKINNSKSVFDDLKNDLNIIFQFYNNYENNFQDGNAFHESEINNYKKNKEEISKMLKEQSKLYYQYCKGM